MAVSTSSAGKAVQAPLSRVTSIEVPRELIEALAYRKFEQRGRMHGYDWSDWFAAEHELSSLFQSVRWAVEHEDNPPCLALRAIGPAHAIRELCRYFQWCPTASSVLAGRHAHFRVVWPEDPHQIRSDLTMKFDRIANATQNQLERAKVAKSPVSVLSGEDFARLKGRLVALLLDGPDKGKVIAEAPLDHEHPEKSRRAVKDQVAASPYNRRRYQLRQILEKTPTDSRDFS